MTRVVRAPIESPMLQKTASIQDRRGAILAKLAAGEGDRVVQRGQGYGAFGSAGRALREATGGAMLHPGDVVKRTADGGFQLMRRGKVLGEVTHDAANKGFAYSKGGAKSPTGLELSGPSFRAYGDLPRNQRGLAQKALAMARRTPAAPAAVATPKTDDVMSAPKLITPMSASDRASADAAAAESRARALKTALPKTPFGGVGVPRPPVSTAESTEE